MRKYLFVFLLILLPQICLATVIHVPGDSGTIQSAIDGSSAGDTVLVDPGIYPENINFLGKNIYLASQFIFSGDSLDISATIIDGQAAGSVVIFNNGEDNTATLTGFTITNGQADYGGGIYCSASNPTIRDNIISDNSAALEGGGIYCDQSSPLIRANSIKSNYSTQYGGGITLVNSNSPIHNNVILANHAGVGGGMSVLNGSPNIYNCTFMLNYVDFYGGGLYSKGEECSPSVRYCNFRANSTGYTVKESDIWEDNSQDPIVYMNNPKSASNAGAGIFLDSGTVASVSNCQFTENTAYSGGGIAGWDASFTVENSSFSNNITENNSGGMTLLFSQVTITNCNFEKNQSKYSSGIQIYKCISVSLQNCTFNRNKSRSTGGAITIWHTPCQISNCTFNANLASKGTSVFMDSSSLIMENCILTNGKYVKPIYCQEAYGPNELQISCTDIYGNYAGNWIEWLEDFEGINGNIELDPLFCDPANSDLSIQYTSPCAPGNNDCGVLIGARPPQNCTPLPLQAVILIDRSGSMFLTNALGESRLERAKAQAKSDIDKLLDPDDADYFGAFEVAIMYFNADGIILLQDFSNDSEILYTAIDDIPGPRHDTPLAAAMCQAHCTLKSTEPGQKLLFTFTDGLENQSQSFDMCSLCEPCNQYMSSGWNFDCGPDNPGSCTDWQLCLYQKFAQSALTNVHYYGEPINPFSKSAGSEGLEDLYFLKATAEGSSGTFYYHSDISTVCGDANYDGDLNIADAIWIINYVFSLGDPPTLMSAGDPNCDSKVNVSDAVYLINYVFTGGEAPCDPNGDGIPDCQP